MNVLYQQNDELRSMHGKNSDLGSIDVSKSYMENSRAEEINRAKQEEIRRLKDSLLVVQKEKDAYQ